MAEAAPVTINGASVIVYSPIDRRHRATGRCRQIVAGVVQGPAAGVAICQYPGEEAFYLFGCDEHWQGQRDTWHPTLAEAMAQAEYEYEGVRRTWLNHRPAWQALTVAEESAIWKVFYERLQFRPSVSADQWPGIAEPVGSVTHSIAHLWGEGGIAGVNAEMFDLLRLLVLPGERLYALDWQHPCYWLNPYGRFEFSETMQGMIPIVPDGDYYIFLAVDLRFGVFGHPWEQTVCVWGEPLLSIMERYRPRVLGDVVRRDGKAVGASG